MHRELASKLENQSDIHARLCAFDQNEVQTRYSTIFLIREFPAERHVELPLVGSVCVSSLNLNGPLVLASPFFTELLVSLFPFLSPSVYVQPFASLLADETTFRDR